MTIKQNNYKRLLQLVIPLLLICTISTAQHIHDQPKDILTIPKKPASPVLSAMAMIGDNHVHIEYGSPSVRGRNIWNGLVAYNQVWATGAHKATWIDFSKDVIIQGKLIPKGKYGFFTIPNKSKWILIISKSWNMHLADDYTIENDIIRLNVKPKKQKSLVESLTYEVVETGKNKGSIKMRWEYLNVSFNFENK